MIDLLTIAQKATNTALAIADGVSETVTFHLGRIGTSIGEDKTLRVFAYKRENIQLGAEQQNSSSGTVNSSVFNEKLLVNAADLDGLEILETDTVTRADGEWQIITADPVPGRALWIVEVQR